MNLEVDIQLERSGFRLDARFESRESALGIFGPSGSGKTTLFLALAGLLKPNGGRIALDGRVLFDSANRIFIPPHKRNIGVVFQDARLFPHWTVEQNLRAGETSESKGENRPYLYDDVVELLSIRHLLDRSIFDLSGGEQQRIAIGRTLLSYPRLLLMDEPVTGLDASLKIQLLPFLAKVHRTLHIPTLLISHDLGDILQLTNHLLLVRGGSIVAHGTLETLSRDPDALNELKGANLVNLIHARVLAHDTQGGTTKLELHDGCGETIRMELSPHLSIGERVCAGIAANQIALAKQRVDSISMRNQIEGTVIEIIHASDRSICHLDTAAGLLFVEITAGTERELHLETGSKIWALFKGLALHPL